MPDAKRYSQLRILLFLGNLFLSGVGLLAFQGFGWSHQLARWADVLSPGSPWGQVGIYGLVFMSAGWLLTFPLNWYGGFYLEHKFELATQSLGAWLGDQVKAALLSLLLGLGLLEGLYFIMRLAPDAWWSLAALGWVGVSLLMAKLLPIWILPLFYTLTPVAKDSLKHRLLDLVERAGLKAIDVFRINMGSKTKKANAALMGLGGTRRVVLGDTLMDNFTDDEIEVVLAHELGHHKLRHMVKLVALSALVSIAGFYLVHVTSQIWVPWLRLSGIQDLAGLPMICFLTAVSGLFLMPLQNGYSRRLERQADQFALDMTQKPEDFVSCMQKLAARNLAELKPHPMVEWIFYDHPSIGKRIEMGQGFKD